MTLTSARGPLGPDPAGRFSPPIAPGTAFVEPHPRRVQAIVAERAVIDTEEVLLVHRPQHPPTYAFPREVVGDLLRAAVRRQEMNDERDSAGSNTGRGRETEELLDAAGDPRRLVRLVVHHRRAAAGQRVVARRFAIQCLQLSRLQ